MEIALLANRYRRIIDYKRSKSQIPFKKSCFKKYLKLPYKKYEIQKIIEIEKVPMDVTDDKLDFYLMEKYISHRYDLLGSGWIEISYAAKPLGMCGQRYENEKNTQKDYFNELEKQIHPEEFESLLKLRQRITKQYIPLVWNRDFKSGYRWGALFLDEVEAVECPKGADIKTVWELGRLPFLPRLAKIAYHHPKYRNQIILEFRNLLYDFFSSNPVCIGVNWICAMEAAIRAANLLLSYDILCQIDEEKILNNEFKEVFIKNIVQHGFFIYDNLEIDAIHLRNGNHYFSNLAGLIAVSSYLSGNVIVKKWYKKIKREFFRECRKQFYKDGGHVEGSTAYHRLVAEMMFYSLAFLIRNGEDIPQDIKYLAEKAVIFDEITADTEGNSVQMGDNDSGRYLSFTVSGDWCTNLEAEKKYKNLKGYCSKYKPEEMYFDENILSHKELKEIFGGIFTAAFVRPLEPSFTEKLVAAITKKEPEKLKENSFYDQEIHTCEKDGEYKYFKETKIELPYKIRWDAVNWGFLRETGIYYFKNHFLSLHLYTGTKKRDQFSGHTHNDLMHCELSINGEKFFHDPGTYVYTADDDGRNQFRSNYAHAAPHFSREARELISTFSCRGEEKCTMTSCDRKGARIEYEAAGIHHIRQVKIHSTYIQILDKSNTEFTFEEESAINYISNGYGKIYRKDVP